MDSLQHNTFEAVQAIIAESTGVKPKKITMETDLRGDLGVRGDDGDELVEALCEAFDVDWNDFDSGIHFGNEGFGLPLPWQLENNCAMYEVQPLSVGDFVRAVAFGHWHGTPRTLLPLAKRREIYLYSILQHSCFGLAIILGLVAAFLG